MMNELARLIQQRRHELGKSQRDLAVDADISPGYVGWLERGQRVPSYPVCEALARALEVSKDEVLRAAGYYPAGHPIELDEQEQEVIALWRQALPRDRHIVLSGLRAAVESEGEEPQ